MASDKFINNLRNAFETAKKSTETYGPIYSVNGNQIQTEKRSEKDIFDSMVFAEDDEKPQLGFSGRPLVQYVPFSWNESGDKHTGYLIMDANSSSGNGKIYGLERDDGMSMTPQGTKKLLEEMVYGSEKEQNEKRQSQTMKFISSILNFKVPQRAKFEPRYSNRFSDPRTAIRNWDTVRASDFSKYNDNYKQAMSIMRGK